MIRSTMQDGPLTIGAIMRHGARVYGRSECVTWTGAGTRRASYATVAQNAGRLAGALARLGIGPGEACGEISFLDELPATANVVAKEEVWAYYLDRQTLQSMFELFPHLGSRFYQSLAAILSRRLRELIGPALPAPKAAYAAEDAGKAEPAKKV